MKNSYFFLLFFLFFAACQKTSEAYYTHFTVLNASPDANGFTIQIGNEKLAAVSTYGIPDYAVPAPAITDSMQWKITSHTSWDSSFLTDLANGANFTLLFFDSSKRYQTYMVRDNWSQPASDSKGYLRIFPMLIGGDSLTLRDDTLKVLTSKRSFADFAGTEIGRAHV